jgi:hypothetical protein
VNRDIDELSKPGTAIVWRSSLPVREVSTIVPCRAQCAFLGAYAILNIYAPSGSDRKFERGSFFAREIFQAFSLHADSHWIFGGDFNCILRPIDVENGTGFMQKRCPQLDDLVKGKNVHDIFRRLHPDAKEYTFFRASAAPSRLVGFIYLKIFFTELNLWNTLHHFLIIVVCFLRLFFRMLRIPQLRRSLSGLIGSLMFQFSKMMISSQTLLIFGPG